MKICEKLAQENCRNILQTLETFDDNMYSYIVTEFLQGGGDLLDYIERQPDHNLDEEHIKSILGQLATAVRVLHRQNIFHQDIKIENVLVKNFSRTTTYKLANFGTAVQLATPKSKFFSKLGTCGYIAPEILNGEACNCAADIYSLGATIYMLFTGRLPFEDEE